MNEDHARLCGSREWAEYLQRDVIAPLLADVDLGARGIEAGPGYGAATDWLRRRVDQLVAVDSDPARVAELKAARRIRSSHSPNALAGSAR